MNDFISLGPTGMTAFWEAVPTVHTDSELSFYRDREGTRAVAPNDLGTSGTLLERFRLSLTSRRE